VASFYSCVLHRSNASLRKEGEREAMARCGSRAGVLARTARHISDVTVAVTLRGGDAEGVCPYAIGSGELPRGWRWTGPRGKRACASTPCLCGARLGSWKLDKAARGVSKEGGSRGAARGVVTGCLALASRRFSDDDSNQPTQ
jgi:hypothetical protein